MVEQYNIILKINYCHRIKEIYNYILFNEEIYKTLEHADYIEIDINKIHFDIIDYSFIFSKNLKKFVNYLKYVKDIHSCSYFISLLIRNIAYTNKIYKYTAQLFIYNNTNNECGTIFLRFVVNNKKEIFEKIGILKRKFTSGNILDIDISIYDHIKNIFINKYNMSFPEERIILSYVKYYYVYRLVNMKKNCDYNTNYSYIFSTNKESNISNTTHITCSSNSYETSDVNCQGPLYIKRKQLQKNIRKYIKCKGKNKLNTVKDKTKLSATQEIYDDDDDLNELYKINNNQNNFKSPSDCYLVRNEYNHKTRQYKNKIIYDHDNVYYSNKCVSQDDYNYYNDTYDDDEKDGNVHNKDVHKDVHNNIHNDVHNNIHNDKLIEVYNVENDSVAMYILNNEDESKKNPKHHQHIFNNDEKKESKSIDLFNKENDKEENNKNSLNNKEYKEDIKNKTYKSIKNINMKYSTNVLKKYPNDILKKGMMNKNVIKEKMNNEKYKDNKINNNQNKNKKQCKNYFIDTCNNNKQNNNSVEIINMNNIPHSKFMYNNYENDLITESVYNEIMKNLSRNMYFLNDEDNILTCVYNYKHILKNILYLENVIEKYNIHMSVIHVSNLQNVKSNQENNNLLNENHPNKISDGNYNKNNQKDNHMEKLKQIIHHIKNKCREYKNTLYKLHIPFNVYYMCV
ncbi:hypothetical protein PFFCH_05678 [Plasmodium falciparum FCH/4]|uniref:Uncharacterized protein n=1 Tax=Plasmodium falciparum FCH/4 TaxID=1036724 RepID=A0A024VEI9_PLAFA|nr:hypothetical protein PFFCH_05678 [Plasmodium falciparum FCH/4]